MGIEKRASGWELFKKQNSLDLVTKWLWGSRVAQLSFWPTSLDGQQCHSPYSEIPEEEKYIPRESEEI